MIKTIDFLGMQLECHYTVFDDVLVFTDVKTARSGADVMPILERALLGRVDKDTGTLGVLPALAALAELLEPTPGAPANDQQWSAATPPAIH